MAKKYNVKRQYAAWVAAASFGSVVVLTAVHVVLNYRTQEAALRNRAQVAAKVLAEAAQTGVRSNSSVAVATAVTIVVQDEAVRRVRVTDAKANELYKLDLDPNRQELLVVRASIGPATNVIGTAEIGLSRAAVAGGIVRTMFIDLILGVALSGIFVGMSFLVSAPVNNALLDLNEYVQRVAAGESHGERLDSDLAEVDQVGRTLTDVVSRVEDGQLRLARAQQELRATQKEMDEYTYVISHDLKEPLRGIEAFSKFLSDGYREKLDDNGQHYVDTIRNSTLRMQRLIGDLLKFSRLSQQKNPMTPVGFNAMLMHVRVNLQYALDQKKVDLRVDRLPTVVCDATAMTEVFHNLISNAIKYNDKPVPIIEVGCAEKPHPETGTLEYEFTIRDNGVGIKKEYFDKIFQIFQRLQRDEEGTGIGLTIVRRVVEWHGGRIWLESTEGQGTAFHFTLPRREITKTGTVVELPKTVPKPGGELAQTI